MDFQIIGSIIALVFILLVVYGGGRQIHQHNKDQDAPKRAIWGGGILIVLAVVGIVVFAGVPMVNAAGTIGQRIFNGENELKVPSLDLGGGDNVDAPQPTRTR